MTIFYTADNQAVFWRLFTHSSEYEKLLEFIKFKECINPPSPQHAIQYDALMNSPKLSL